MRFLVVLDVESIRRRVKVETKVSAQSTKKMELPLVELESVAKEQKMDFNIRRLSKRVEISIRD